MTNLGAVFIELVRRAKEGKGSSFYQQCERCNQRTMYVLTAATSTQEIYSCASCGFTKFWTVK